MLPKNKELDVLPYVKDKTFSIDDKGRIWRTKSMTRAEHNAGEYFQVRIMRDGIRHHALAHRLVWVYFNGPIPDGMTINHKNGVKKDNRLANLEVATYSEQIVHAVRVLGKMRQDGERNHNTKLTNAQVFEIRNRYATGGITQKELADEFRISFQNVSDIVRGRRRRNQKGKTNDYTHRRWGKNPKRGADGKFCSSS